MKKNIGVIILVLFNILFFCLFAVCIGYILMIDRVKGGRLSLENSEFYVSRDLLIAFGIFIISLIISYVVLNKLILYKNSFILSLIQALILSGLFLFVFIKLDKNIYNYHKKNTTLRNWLYEENIKQIRIISSTKSVKIKNPQLFFNELDSVKYNGKTIIKFYKKSKIIFYKPNNYNDTVYSNGNVFQIKDRYFYCKNNFLEKYIR